MPQRARRVLGRADDLCFHGGPESADGHEQDNAVLWAACGSVPWYGAITANAEHVVPMRSRSIGTTPETQKRFAGFEDTYGRAFGTCEHRRTSYVPVRLASLRAISGDCGQDGSVDGSEVSAAKR